MVLTLSENGNNVISSANTTITFSTYNSTIIKIGTNTIWILDPVIAPYIGLILTINLGQIPALLSRTDTRTKSRAGTSTLFRTDTMVNLRIVLVQI